jgi:hypothetical protein
LQSRAAAIMRFRKRMEYEYRHGSNVSITAAPR